MEKITFTWNPMDDNKDFHNAHKAIKILISSTIDAYTMLSAILGKSNAKEIIMKQIDKSFENAEE